MVKALGLVALLVLLAAPAHAATGGRGPDVLRGTVGADSLEGGGGSDLLLGNGGDDVLDGGPGADLVRGGAGYDVCIAGPFDVVRGCEEVIPG